MHPQAGDRLTMVRQVVRPDLCDQELSSQLQMPAGLTVGQRRPCGVAYQAAEIELRRPDVRRPRMVPMLWVPCRRLGAALAWELGVIFDSEIYMSVETDCANATAGIRAGWCPT